VAAVGTCLAAALAEMSPNGFSPSKLVHLGDGEPLAATARATDPGFVLVPGTSHYDGVYYYAIGRDPLARGPEHRLIDAPAYRYGHAGFGWLAWITSAGKPSRVPIALLVVLLECAGLAGAAAAWLARDLGLSPWWGLTVALNPGVVYSATVLTSEPAGVAALLLGLFAWRRGRWVAATVALAAACLIKEPFVLVPLGIALFQLVEWVRAQDGSERSSLRALVTRCAPLALAPLPFACWYAYVWQRFDAFPAHQVRGFAGLPFAGWIDTLRRAASFNDGDFPTAQIGAATIPLVVVIGLALVIGAVRSLRARSEVEVVFLLFALLAFSLNWWSLLYPKDLVRELAVQLVLLPYVFAPGLASRQPGRVAPEDGDVLVGEE
jgi:hypothetical protein